MPVTLEMTARELECAAGVARGWAYIPLAGKIPRLLEWTTRPPAELEQVLEWARTGNVGLRTGTVSGIIVVDEDLGGDLDQLWAKLGVPAPKTPTVLTGGGGRHMYFAANGHEVRNSASRIADYIDVRGDGGQVVAATSIHPDTDMPYQWALGLSPDDVSFAPLPEAVVEALRAPRPKSVPAPAAPPADDGRGASRYGARALAGECAAVASAMEGTRNDTLNRAAFAIGQLVAGGEIPEGLAVQSLREAAGACGLPPEEAERVITGGLAAGSGEPRRGNRTPMRHARPSEGPPADGAPQEERAGNLEEDQVLVPGSHVTDQDEYIERGHDEFVAEVMGRLPKDALYRRGGYCGTLAAMRGRLRFSAMTSARMRCEIDRAMRLVRWKEVGRGEDKHQAKVYCPCGRDAGEMVSELGGDSPELRELNAITPYPSYGPDWKLVRPGWNAESGLYYDEPKGLRGLKPIRDPVEIRAILEDLVVDFPFKDEASKHNFFGMLFTPLIRPAIVGNVPLHLVTAPLERSGKSLLIEVVWGGTFLGVPLAATVWPEGEEERKKQVTASAIEGESLMHLDNLPGRLNSPTLASLLTATEIKGRVLGESKTALMPNLMIVAASGNNLRLSGEMAKRSIPICLAPANERPEDRYDFLHPRIREYVQENRPRILGALIGAVENWRSAGGLDGPVVLGGFNSWAWAVGGIMVQLDLMSWMGNHRAWADEANSDREDLLTFVTEWSSRVVDPSTGKFPKELLEYVKDLGIWPHVLTGRTDDGASATLARQVARYIGTPVGGWFIRRKKYGSGHVYYLEPIQQANAT